MRGERKSPTKKKGRKQYTLHSADINLSPEVNKQLFYAWKYIFVLLSDIIIIHKMNGTSLTEIWTQPDNCILCSNNCHITYSSIEMLPW